MSRSESRSIGFVIAEKFFGLIILILGALLLHYTNSTVGNIAGAGIPQATDVAFFIQVFMYAISIGLIGLGILLILAKTS